jgi:chromatin modification-related protein VID21
MHEAIAHTFAHRLMLYKGADENSGIVTSRKRKLREFFAVCDHEGPIPILSYEDPDAPPTNEKEERFLDVCDILQYVFPVVQSS